jgi:DNA-directed RNA polymerase subunit RPC12/RpoP
MGKVTKKAAKKQEQEKKQPNPRFPVWPDGKCDHCGHQVPPDSEEPYSYKLQCPNCGRDGCEECMPFGRGVACPDCED